MSQKNQTILLSVTLFYVIALPLILLDYNAGRAFSDQYFGHLPAIRFFIEQLDFSDYPSATTPGYHVLLAVFAKFCSQNIMILKLFSSLITAAFIGLFAGVLYPKAGRLKTILLLLPMIFSLYFLPDGVWLVPDNLGWLTVAVLFILAATCPLTVPYFISTCAVLFIAVAVRQTNIWLAAIPWSVGLAYLLFDNSALRIQKKITPLALSVLITVPAFLLLLYFYITWDGLVPPSVQNRHERSLSYCVPAFFFSLFFIYTLFYTPFVLRAIRPLLSRQTYYFIAAGGILGFLLAVIPATDYNYEVGRFSGFWNFVRLAPAINHTSVLITITSTLGGAAFVSWLLLLKKEFRLILSISSLAFVLALIPNALVLERYFAVFIFILIYLILYRTDQINWQELPTSALLGPITFTLINCLFLFRGIFPGLVP